MSVSDEYTCSPESCRIIHWYELILLILLVPSVYQQMVLHWNYKIAMDKKFKTAALSTTDSNCIPMEWSESTSKNCN